MIKISHRGNLNGPNPEMENKPQYIEKAIEAGFDCEIDVWLHGSDFYLGHDFAETKIKALWIASIMEKLWVHCKNLEALCAFKGAVFGNYFYHQGDDYTLTSQGNIWTFPGVAYNENCIVVNNTKNKIKNCLGVCSDYISLYE